MVEVAALETEAVAVVALEVSEPAQACQLLLALLTRSRLARGALEQHRKIPTGPLAIILYSAPLHLLAADLAQDKREMAVLAVLVAVVETLAVPAAVGQAALVTHQTLPHHKVIMVGMEEVDLVQPVAMTDITVAAAAVPLLLEEMLLAHEEGMVAMEWCLVLVDHQ